MTLRPLLLYQPPSQGGRGWSQVSRRPRPPLQTPAALLVPRLRLKPERWGASPTPEPLHHSSTGRPCWSVWQERVTALSLGPCQDRSYKPLAC